MYVAPMRRRANTIPSWPPPPAPGSIVPEEPVAAPVTCPPPASAKVPKTAAMLALQRVVEAAKRERSKTLEVIIDDDVLEEEPIVAAAPPPLPTQRPEPARVVREMVRELEPRATASQAAGVCAAVLAGTLRARAVVIHAHDPRTGAVRIIGADGVGTQDLVGSTYAADDDFVASTVLANEHVMRLRFDEGLPRSAPSRLREVGASRSLLAVPVVALHACVAIIEVIDADASLESLALDACHRAAEALVRCQVSRPTAP